MTQLHVSYAEIAQTAQRLRAAADAIDADLDHLDQQVQRLRGQFTGAASDAYDKAHADWDGTARSMRKILTQLAQRIEVTLTTYDGYDQKIAKAMH